MKRIVLLILFTSITGLIFAQADFCTTLLKATGAAANNFNQYNSFAYNTVGKQKAYTADFSFIAGTTGYIYRDDIQQTTQFIQTITTDQSRYYEFFRNVDKCLLTDVNRWTKLETADRKGVIFNCDKTGAEVFLFNVANQGVTITIERDKKKSITVFAPGFCDDLTKLVNDLDNNFKNSMGVFKDSSILGKSYKGNIKLNQRGIGPVIYAGPDWSDRKKTKYKYTEMISGTEMSPAEVQVYFDNCLTPAKGWQKSNNKFGDGVIYRKGNTGVQLNTSKAYGSKDSDNTHINIEKQN